MRRRIGATSEIGRDGSSRSHVPVKCRAEVINMRPSNLQGAHAPPRAKLYAVRRQSAFTQSGQRLSKMRRRSSTSFNASCERTPHLEISRSFETKRIASHKITLSFLVPPSPLRTFTCNGISRSVEVSGKTTIKSAGPALKESTESTSTGLRPVCSRPRVGRRSASQISPRCG